MVTALLTYYDAGSGDAASPVATMGEAGISNWSNAQKASTNMGSEVKNPQK
jgi:hypothetical protein